MFFENKHTKGLKGYQDTIKKQKPFKQQKPHKKTKA
jgi:hypothetical protein